MNVRRALRWFRDRLAAAADGGRLSLRVDGRFVAAESAADVDAWLLGLTLPSMLERRRSGPARLVALGGEVAS